MQHNTLSTAWDGKIILLAAAIIMSTTACAEPSTAPGAAADSPEVEAKMLELYIQNRARRSADELTQEQRDQLASELDDLRLMAKQADKEGLADKTEVAAQLRLQRLSILTSALAAEYLRENPVGDAELQSEYAARFGGEQSPQYKARHILVETEEAAKAVITELDGGADFAELAKEKSTGPSGPNGGDLGWFPPESMVKPFSDAVIALENGAYSAAPVQTQFGWHVILREDSRVPEAPAFDEVKDRLRPAVEQRKLQVYLEGLRAENPETAQ